MDASAARSSTVAQKSATMGAGTRRRRAGALVAVVGSSSVAVADLGRPDDRSRSRSRDDGSSDCTADADADAGADTDDDAAVDDDLALKRKPGACRKGRAASGDAGDAGRGEEG